MNEKLIYTLADTEAAASELFHTFSPGTPELLPTGIKSLDQTIGGLGPKTMMVVGAAGGLGKSTVALDAVLSSAESGTKGGFINCEDAPDVLGCRLLGRASGVDSLKIRKKSFSDKEAEMLEIGQEMLREDAGSAYAPLFAYPIGQSLERVQDCVKLMADEGCRVIWVDYLQKIRGGHDDRRQEIGRVITGLHATAAETNTAIVLVSQLSRTGEGGGKPTAIRHHSALKESGDIENEARVIVMLGAPNGNQEGIEGVVTKSNYGGEGLRLHWFRDTCGTLRQGKNPDKEVADDF